MRNLTLGMLALLLCVSNAFAAAPPDVDKKPALDKVALEKYVRHLLLWSDQIKVEIFDPKPSPMKGFHEVTVRGSAGAAFQEKTFHISEDGSQLVSAIVYDIKENPFQEEMEKINTTAQPYLGTSGAPVKLVLFSDFECAFCKQESILLRENLLKTYPEQVRLYFVNYPLKSIHPWSVDAAVASRCFFAQSNDAFWAFHDWAYEHQSEITVDNLTDKTMEFASTLQGVDTLMLRSCIESKATLSEVEGEVAQALALGLNSTPTLFINGRKIAQQIPWSNLKQIIDFELEYQKTAQNAGDNADDCCSVQLKTPLSQ